MSETSIEKLMVYQQDLLAEEQWLKRMITKLNTQTHALQVEQLHILNALNSKTNSNAKTSTTENTEMDIKKVTTETQDLDLTVPNFQSSEEDEDEIED